MPGEEKRVSWHQDSSYWPLTPAKAVTDWLAIDDSDEDNGAVQVIPGLHQHGQIGFEDSGADENNVLNQTVREANASGEAPTSLVMKSG